jgi:hypothetical protein
VGEEGVAPGGGGESEESDEGGCERDVSDAAGDAGMVRKAPPRGRWMRDPIYARCGCVCAGGGGAGGDVCDVRAGEVRR